MEEERESERATFIYGLSGATEAPQAPAAQDFPRRGFSPPDLG